MGDFCREQWDQLFSQADLLILQIDTVGLSVYGFCMDGFNPPRTENVQEKKKVVSVLKTYRYISCHCSLNDTTGQAFP